MTQRNKQMSKRSSWQTWNAVERCSHAECKSTRPCLNASMAGVPASNTGDIQSHWQHTHTHTRLTALFPGLPRWAGTRKVNQSWFYWSKGQWVAVASLSFLQAGCPSCRPTNSVKALKTELFIHMRIDWGQRTQQISLFLRPIYKISYNLS